MIKKSDNKLIDFFKIWTTKEAYIKKHGLNGSYVKKIDSTKEKPIFKLEGDYIISILK